MPPWYFALLFVLYFWFSFSHSAPLHSTPLTKLSGKSARCLRHRYSSRHRCLSAACRRCNDHRLPNTENHSSFGRATATATSGTMSDRTTYAQVLQRMHSAVKSAQMPKCTNAQMHKCSNAQLHKCSNAQMLKCSNAQMHKCTKMHECTSGAIPKCTNAQLFKLLNRTNTQKLVQPTRWHRHGERKARASRIHATGWLDNVHREKLEAKEETASARRVAGE